MDDAKFSKHYDHSFLLLWFYQSVLQHKLVLKLKLNLLNINWMVLCSVWSTSPAVLPIHPWPVYMYNFLKGSSNFRIWVSPNLKLLSLFSTHLHNIDSLCLPPFNLWSYKIDGNKLSTLLPVFWNSAFFSCYFFISLLNHLGSNYKPEIVTKSLQWQLFSSANIWMQFSWPVLFFECAICSYLLEKEAS